MAVYKEGWFWLEDIEQSSVPIFNDAADMGAPCRKDDSMWNTVKWMFDWYADCDRIAVLHVINDLNKPKGERITVEVEEV